jgi:hypothetical protein
MRCIQVESEVVYMKISVGKPAKAASVTKPTRKAVSSRLRTNVSTRRYYTPEEVMGENWRIGLDKVKDEWE